MLCATLLDWLLKSHQTHVLPEHRESSDPESVPPVKASALDAKADIQFANVPGLDSAKGLSLMRGDAAKYLKLLRLFADRHTSDMEHLASMLGGCGDISSASAFVHRLKGAAATVGAKQVTESANALEIALRNNASGEECELLSAYDYNLATAPGSLRSLI